MVLNLDHIVTDSTHDRSLNFAPPRPDVSEPNLREYGNACVLGSSIRHRDDEKKVFRCCLCILKRDIEIPVIVKHPGVR